MNEFDVWLEDLSTEAVPGGVAAAAVAAAMGAALVAKAVRVTLKHHSIPQTSRPFLQEVLDGAGEQSSILLDLASADIRAFRAVLDLGPRRAGSPAARQVWLEATDVPIRVAEACQALLASLPGLFGLCWPSVYPDLRTGGWLLEAAKQAGLLAAETNLHALEDVAEAHSLRRRMRNLDDRRDN